MQTPNSVQIELPRPFKGVWIFRKLWCDKRLTWLQKCLLAEIDALSTDEQGCTASNEYLCQMFDVVERRMANMLSELKQTGFLIVGKAESGLRELRVSLPNVTEPVKNSVTEPVQKNDPQYTRGTSTKVPPIVPQGDGNKKKGLFRNPNMLRLDKLFSRRNTTAWSEDELKWLRRIEPIPEDELEAVERYYTASHPPDSDYRRRDLVRLLRHWNGEVDRARQFKPNRGY